MAIVCFSCASGPETEKKSPLNYLSGEHYDANVTSGVVPIHLKRKKKYTSLSGNCFFQIKNDDYKYPVKFQKLRLLKDGKEISSTTTSNNGDFKISSHLENGRYELVLDTAKYEGKMVIEVSQYEHQDIPLKVNKR